jgi:hypothetical protein
VEAPDLHPADAHPQARSAWDASVCAHPDAAADEARLYLRHRRQREAGVEKLAGRERDVRAQDGKFRRLELQAAPAAELAAPALCKLDVARSVGRSCAELEEAEQPDALKQEPRAEHSRKPPQSRLQAEPAQQKAAPRAVPAGRQPATRKPAALQPAQEAQPQPVYRQPTVA